MARSGKKLRAFRACVSRHGGGKRARGKCLGKVYGKRRRRR